MKTASDQATGSSGRTPPVEESDASALNIGTLVELYNRWFDVVPADTPALVEEAYRIRFQVYCVENPFEDPAEHPSGLEIDEFDSHSVHSLLIHRASGQVAGTVRLILPQPDHPGCGLPIVRICHEPALQDPRIFPTAQTAEISRFAISKLFRRRLTDLQVPDSHVMTVPNSKLVERRITPHITLGLMKAVAQMSLQHNITHLCAVMEPALLRLIGRLGIRFTPLGPLVKYHGLRQPCYSDITALGHGLLHQCPDALGVITEQGRYWQANRKVAAGV